MSRLTVGILLAALSVAMYSTGMVLEKLATRRLPSIHARHGLRMVATLSRDPLWVLGFLLLMLGLGTQVLALTSAPISIVQAVAACGIALFLVLSHFVLGETLTRFEYVGLAAILGSLLLLGLSVDPRDDLVTGSTSLSMIFDVGIPAVLVGVCLFLLTDRLRVSPARSPHVKAPLFGLSSGLLYGVAALGVKEVSTIVKQDGLIDSVPHVLESPGFYLFLVSTGLGFLVFQTALQRTTASVFVPVNNVTSSCYFIIAGTVLFHERLPSGGAPLFLRLGAFMMILLGLMILSVSKSVVPVRSGLPVHEVREVTPSGWDEKTAAEFGVHHGNGHTVVTSNGNGNGATTNGRAPVPQAGVAPEESDISVESMLRKSRALGPYSPAVGNHLADGHDHLWPLSFIDPHTGLANHLLVLDRLTQALLRRARHKGQVVVCLIKLQNLVPTNAEFGYADRGSLLCEVSRRLISVIRAEDTVGRVGGHELVIVITVNHEQAVGPLLHRIQYTLDEPVMTAGRKVRLPSSLGVAVADVTESAEDVLARAGRSTRIVRQPSQSRTFTN